MKHLHLVLSLSLVAFIATFSIAAADSYDSEKATIKKGGAHTAKVLIGSKTYSAPVSFADGASWDTVKDHYEVSSDTASEIKEGEIAISIGADGTASFMKTHREHKAASKPAATK